MGKRPSPKKFLKCYKKVRKKGIQGDEFADLVAKCVMEEKE